MHNHWVLSSSCLEALCRGDSFLCSEEFWFLIRESIWKKKVQTRASQFVSFIHGKIMNLLELEICQLPNPSALDQCHAEPMHSEETFIAFLGWGDTNLVLFLLLYGLSAEEENGLGQWLMCSRSPELCHLVIQLHGMQWHKSRGRLHASEWIHSEERKSGRLSGKELIREPEK